MGAVLKFPHRKTLLELNQDELDRATTAARYPYRKRSLRRTGKRHSETLPVRARLIMAARLNPRHQQFVRDKIKAGQLVKLLANHAHGLSEMTPTQVRAAEILLKKSVPDLSAMALTGEGGGPIKGLVTVEYVRPESKD